MRCVFCRLKGMSVGAGDTGGTEMEQRGGRWFCAACGASAWWDRKGNGDPEMVAGNFVVPEGVMEVWNS